MDRLTSREREVVGLVIEGLSNNDIAQKLDLSVKTIETHRANVNRKLNVHSSLQLFRYAAFAGWVPGLAAGHPEAIKSLRTHGLLPSKGERS